ncbi:hypothetical protein CEP48_01600 [Mergibacter septicus]|uniref:Uncharacterized protein n=1 Tax=Mergibacter septicus TaxID=221402 RepID=A0A8D4LMY3_9PAST|nr:DsrH/TusB family sulfur metabolism protein [Mergibacter septicus]AWX14943.1 hypothetical protein CEP47_01600 [Mergibacter septicus]QDJ12384.1 hypothetical protein CEP45_00280 [Mergibacter septicus]QDJ14195.1 hypothetical protein CEP48_01600 [Mergibacter septicus]UTU48358.1 hypothetical protein HLL31_06025 [Mergibacter septicus]WMR96015.1 DsrH/TusB family sulfur metabolism protein [Mergibacter septicus]
MLYTFAHAHYDQHFLNAILSNITENDALILWQDGVLLALKTPKLFSHLPIRCSILDVDFTARNLHLLFNRLPLKYQTLFEKISLEQLVEKTEKYSPHFAY